MNGSKRARNAASMTNQTSHFGTMAGTVSLTGKTWAVRNALIRNGNYCNCIGGEQVPSGVGPAGAAAGLAFLTRKNALSVNPQCTGGVGRLSNTRFGGCGAAH